ncbi:MAG: beta-propeller fold lactonase family protein [Planctomycetes bacterium]|nr:beta-propeller fold lactonase family protein [Planctomycetota bacterium]
MRSMLATAFGIAVTVLVAGAAAQTRPVFDSGPVAPLAVCADGTRLFAADTLGGNLVVMDLGDPAAPFLLAEIPVGLDPVSVRPRTRDEVWVTCVAGDQVAIVDVGLGRVVDTLRVVDEPSDVVFAGGRAFVSAAGSDEVHVFDAVTRAPLGVVPVFGKDPRALAVSPDGSRVYVVAQRSGNGTTILPASVAPLPPVPWNPLLPPAPEQGLIVRADDPAYAAWIPYSLPDLDVFELDVATLAVTRTFAAVGTTNTAIAVDAANGDLWVANLEAQNLVRFEPNLRGHAIDSRVTRITTGTTPTVTPFDLNPGLDYTVLPNQAALASALAEPFGVAVDAAASRLYVAAHGTDRLGVLDLAGNVVARVELGAAGALVDTRNKRGPRGLALHPTAQRLYVLNRLSDTLAVVDTQTLAVLGELPLATVDALPAQQRQGRNFLYDAKLSGNGTMSCASCHIDGDVDGLAWDLGDPGGDLQAPIPQATLFFPLLVPFHPMKGPMTTQTLRGLVPGQLLHWRGDRADFQAFDGAFDSLLGGAVIPAADMDDFAAATMAQQFPPNPHQMLDRSLRTAPVGNNEAAGRAAFLQNISPPGQGNVSCIACHVLPAGSDGTVIDADTISVPQQMKVAQLRGLYRKLGMGAGPGPQKAGFGFLHDGEVDTLERFTLLPQFQQWPMATRDDIATFLKSLDTGTAPAVGYQVVLRQDNATDPALAAAATLLTTRAAAGDLQLVGHGRLGGPADGVTTGLLYDAPAALFFADRPGFGPFSATDLQNLALTDQLAMAFTAVLPGDGVRLGLDRDEDGIGDGLEAPLGYGQASVGCAGEPTLAANSEPRLGNARFGFVLRAAMPGTVGVFALSLGSASLPILGVEVLVDPATAVLVTVPSDAFGEATVAFPVAASPAVAGVTVYSQALWLDLCAPQFWAASRGLATTIVP